MSPSKPVSSPTKRTRPGAHQAIFHRLLKTISVKATPDLEAVSPSTSTTGQEKIGRRDHKALLIKVSQAKALAARIRAPREVSTAPALPYATQARRPLSKNGRKSGSRFRVTKRDAPLMAIAEPSAPLPTSPTRMVESEEGVEVVLPPPMASEDVRITSPMDMVFPTTPQPDVPFLLPPSLAAPSLDESMAALSAPQDLVPVHSPAHPMSPTSPPPPFLPAPDFLPVVDVPMNTPGGPESPPSFIEVEATDAKMNSPSPPATDVEDPSTVVPDQEDTRMASVSPPATKTTFGSIDVVMSELVARGNASSTPLPIPESMESPPATEVPDSLFCPPEPDVITLVKYPTYSNPFFGLDEDGIYDGFVGPHLNMQEDESGWGTKYRPTVETPTPASSTPMSSDTTTPPTPSPSNTTLAATLAPVATAAPLSPSPSTEAPRTPASRPLKRGHSEIQGTRTSSPLRRSGSGSSSLFDSLDKIVSDDESGYTSLEELDVDSQPPPPKRLRLRYSDGFQLYRHNIWPRNVDPSPPLAGPSTEGGSKEGDAISSQETTPSSVLPHIPSEPEADLKFLRGQFQDPLPERCVVDTIVPLSLIKGDQEGHIHLRPLPPAKAMMKPPKGILKRPVVLPAEEHPNANERPQTPTPPSQPQPSRLKSESKVRLDARSVEFKSRPSLQGGIARLGKPGVLVRTMPQARTNRAPGFLKRLAQTLRERAPHIYGRASLLNSGLGEGCSSSLAGVDGGLEVSKAPKANDSLTGCVSDRAASPQPSLSPSLPSSYSPPPPSSSSGLSTSTDPMPKPRVPQEPEVEEGEITSHDDRPMLSTSTSTSRPSPTPSSSSSSSASSPSSSGSDDERDSNSEFRLRDIGSLGASSCLGGYLPAARPSGSSERAQFQPRLGYSGAQPPRYHPYSASQADSGLGLGLGSSSAGPGGSSGRGRWNVWTREGHGRQEGSSRQGSHNGRTREYSTFPKPWRRWGS